MQVINSGVDTIRLKLTLEPNLPVNDDDFKYQMMSMGWDTQSRSFFGDTTEENLSEKATYAFQSENGTLRCHVINSGTVIMVEYSVPRFINDSALNFQLASKEETLSSIEKVKSELKARIPESVELTLEKITRIDLALDVYAFEQVIGLIAAASQFKIPNAKNPTLNIYPNETTTISSAGAVFRTYNKALEVSKKKLKTLTKTEQLMVKEATTKGRVRLEYVFKKRGGYSLEFLNGNYLHKLGEILKKGFGNNIIALGGLSKIQEVIENLDIHERTRASLYMFAIRYMTLGAKGTKAIMSESSYYGSPPK